ncbi:MAG TPA: acyl-CoA carboxylase subunit epsilon [Jatrophihabitans sp.]|nr:acyl-CoA carboxylase subunit epsilon [Jatrophihabitans sp.]
MTLRIVRGEPTAEELAVVTALVAAAGNGAAAPEPQQPRGGWSDPARQVRRQLLPGSGAWRSSYLR